MPDLDEELAVDARGERIDVAQANLGRQRQIDAEILVGVVITDIGRRATIKANKTLPKFVTRVLEGPAPRADS
jgi:hypothetical protein